MSQKYVTSEYYKCTRTSCTLRQSSQVPVFIDQKPKATPGNFITPTRYTRTIQSWRYGSLRDFSYDSEGVYLSGYGTNTSMGQINLKKDLDTLTGRDLPTELAQRFNDSILNLSMMAKDLYDASNMALDYFKRVRRCWKDLKRGNYRKAFGSFSGSRKLSKGMANNWLAFQYGVLPTIRSVQSAFEAANNQKSQTVRLVCTVKGELIQHCESSKYWSIYGQYKEENSLRGFRYFTTKESIRNLLVTNQAEVAWDATPYTFLLDWFVPIGDYLKQFGYSTNLRASTGCNSSRRKVEFFSGGSYLGSNGPLKTWDEGGYRLLSFTRTIRSDIVWRPSFTEVINNSKIGLTTNRCVNAFALLVQRIR